MKRTITLNGTLLLVLLLFFSQAIYSQTINRWHQDGKIYFKFMDNVNLNYPSSDWGAMELQDVEFLSPLVDKYDISSIKKPFFTANDKKLNRTYLVDFKKIDLVAEFIIELENMNIIEYAEPAPIFKPYLVPNDTYYDMSVDGGMLYGSSNSSWQLNVINAAAAWDITTGDPNIKVAVLDNAIWTGHPDLINKIAFEIDLGDSDSTATPPEATYIWSHGTHAAGLIAAETNNNIGVASIGYDVSLIAVKLGQDASDGQGMTAGFEGIVWAADNGADVISMSWGSPQYFQTMQNTINYAYNKGCTMLAAAGNNGDGAETQMNPEIPINYVGYPAALEHVIAVASTNYNDAKASSSEYGTWIDVCSPGGVGSAGGILGELLTFQVLSTTYTDAGTVLDMLNGAAGGAADFGITGKYDCMQGTSMACPVAAGLAGLMKSVNPDLTPGELKDIMVATCDNIDAQNTSFIDSIGGGRINAAAAVQAVLDSMGLITADFEASDVGIFPDDTVNFTDLSTGSPTSWLWTFDGGTPASSTEQNPTGILYDTEGVFTVTLEVSDGVNSDVEVKNALILVGGFISAESAWLRQNSAFTSQYRGIFDIAIANDSTAWGLSYDGTSGTMTTDFTRTTNGGQQWTTGIIDAANGLTPGNITAIGPDKAWVSMYNTSGGSGIYNTVDGGQTWNHQASASFSDAASFANVVHFFNDNDGFCMGDPINGEFELYTTTDGGANWVLVDGANIPDPLSGEMGWTSVYDVVGDIVWFGTNNGRIYKSTDKGFTWSVISSGEANVSNISMNDDMNGVMLAAENDQTTGELLSWAMKSTTDGGQTWSLVSNNMNESKSGIDAVPGVPGMVVGYKISQTTEENFSAYSMDYGNAWTILDDSVQYTSVKFLNETTGWAGSFNMTDSYDGIYKWIGVPSTTAPYFTSAPITSVIEDSIYTYLAVTQDPDGDSVILEATVLPSWLTFTHNGDSTGTLTGTPTFADIGTHAVELIVYDSIDTAYQSFNITVITNDVPPEFTSIPVTEGYTGAIYTYDVTVTDQDIADVLTIGSTTLPSWLTLTDNGDHTGLLTGIPSSGSPMPGDLVVLTVNDGELTTEQSFNIYIPFTNPYDPPYFSSVADSLAIFGNVYTYNITVVDPDGDIVSIDASTLPAWLTLTDNGDNTATLTGTPPVNDTSYYVALTANDSMFPLVTQAFNIHVSSTFAPPVFTSVPDTVAYYNEVYTYNITVTDADGDIVAIDANSLPAWLTLTDNGDNTALLTGTPMVWDTSFTITLTAADGVHPEVIQEYELYVDINFAPPAFTSTPDTIAYYGEVYTYNITVDDADGDLVILAAGSLPAWLTFTDNGDNSGLLTGSPTVYDTSYVITLTANDGLFNDVVQEYTLYVVNNQSPPVFTSTPDTIANFGEIYNYIVTVDDADGDLATLAATSLPTWLSFTDNGDNTGLLTGNPVVYDTSYVITLTANDSLFDDVIQEYTLYVVNNQSPPVFISTADTVASVNSVYTYNIEVSDSDGDTATISAVSIPSWLSLTDNGDNTALLTGTPTVADTTYQIILAANDGLFPDVLQIFNIHTIDLGSPPYFTSIPDTIGILNEQYTYNISAHDDDGDVLTISAIVLPDWLTLTSFGSSTALLHGTPVEPDTTYLVTISVTDGTNQPVEQTFNIYIDQKPEFTSIPDTSGMVDELYTYNVTATDADNDDLVFSATTLPAWLTFTDNADGTALLEGTPGAIDGDQQHQVVLSVSDGFVSVTQEFFIDVQTNSIYELNNDLMNIWPNPATDNIMIEYKDGNSGDVELRIFNVLGDIVYYSHNISENGKVSKTVDISGFVKGVYLVEIISGRQISNCRIVKQ